MRVALYTGTQETYLPKSIIAQPQSPEDAELPAWLFIIHRP